MKNILIYKMIILNVLALLWLVATNTQTNWLTDMFVSDSSRVTLMILGLFVFVQIGVGYKAFILNRVSNGLHPEVRWMKQKSSFIGTFRLHDITWIEMAAGWMLFLGLIGTLIGLRMSIAQINTGNLSNVEGVKTIAVQLISGLNVELSSTLVGAMAALWTEVNYTLLRRAVWWVVTTEEDMKIGRHSSY